MTITGVQTEKKSGTKIIIRIIEAVIVAAVMAVLIGGTVPKTVLAKTYTIKNKTEFQNIPRYRGGVFKLTKDIKLGEYDKGMWLEGSDEGSNSTFVIDFNGHQVKGACDEIFRINAPKAKVTFKDSKANSKKASVLSTSKHLNGRVFDIDYGKVIFKNGNYQAKGINCIVIKLDNTFDDAATVNIQGGTYTSEKDNAVYCSTGGKLTISGGTFTSKGSNSNDGSALLYYGKYGEGDLRITKGTFKSTKGKWAIVARPYEWKVNQTNADFTKTLLYNGKYSKSYSYERDEYGRVVFKSKTVSVKKK